MDDPAQSGVPPQRPSQNSCLNRVIRRSSGDCGVWAQPALPVMLEPQLGSKQNTHRANCNSRLTNESTITRADSCVTALTGLCGPADVVTRLRID
jgi:hypothetical protein